MRKNLAIVMASVCLLNFGINQVQAEDGRCAEVLMTTCSGCHTMEKACDKIGGPESKWLARLNMMVVNGAELENGDKHMMVKCMTEPFEEAKAVCWK